MNHTRILRSRLIGREVRISYCSKEFQGRLINETRNTLVLQPNRSNKKVIIPKVEATTIKLAMSPKKTLQIRGDVLTGRSVDRLKKRWKSW